MSNFTSEITLLFYNDYGYSIDFFDNVLGLELVMDKGFARIYSVHGNAFLGIFRTNDEFLYLGSTLVSLHTTELDRDFDRISSLKVYDLSPVKRIEAVPVDSFFFDDKEGHSFEILQFVNLDDLNMF